MKQVGAYSMALVLVLGLCGCAQQDPPEMAEKAIEPAPAAEPTPPPQPAPVEPEPAPPPQPVEPSAEEIARETVWAPSREGRLIQGLDGGRYEPYNHSVVQQVQQQLQRKGLYNGPIHGILDQDTMEALGEYQKNNALQVCGVPTPRTREALLAEA